MLLRDQVLLIRKRYKNITPEYCFYNNAVELKRITKRILVIALVQTENQGAFVAYITFSSRHSRNYKSWVSYWTMPQKPRDETERQFLKKKRWKAYPSINQVLKQRLVPKMGSRYGETWKLLKVIGWQLLKGARE